MKFVGLVIFAIIIGWYCIPYELDFEIDKNSRISIPLKGGAVIYLDDEQKEELSNILDGIHVKREFLNGYRTVTYDAYNLITVFFHSVSESTPNHTKGMVINLSTNEYGFKNVPDEEGSIEFLPYGRNSKIQKTEKLRNFIVRLIKAKKCK